MPRPQNRPLNGLVVVVAGLALTLGLLTGLAAQAAADDMSAAEKALFMAKQLGNIKAPTTLHYSFRKTGSMEEGFVDKVAMPLSAQASGECCAASVQFLSGARQLSLPVVEGAQGNPVILHFLEHDIREMNRLTKGSQTYFRKRIRMSLFRGATLTPVSLRYQGREVAGQEIAITPYLEDPMRMRYEKLADKEYRFLLSDAVPGGVYGIRTLIGRASAPLIIEELFIEGAEPATASRTP
jgi:hypothetical protein